LSGLEKRKFCNNYLYPPAAITAMDIAEGMRIVGLGLYLERQNTLVISDVHIGFEEALNKQGILVPRFQFRDTLQRMKGIFVQLPKLGDIIISGDVKHEFGTISEQEWRETLQFLDFLAEHCRQVILVKGNHDTILGPIAKKRSVVIADHYCVGSVYVHHGHVIPDDADIKEANAVIIGHEHPAVSIRDGSRVETFKCFLKGNWRGKTLIVLPSMNAVTTGTDVLKEEILSPFLKQKLGDFEVFVADDTAYYFGKVRDLK
jgi:uncharacterized protein